MLSSNSKDDDYEVGKAESKEDKRRETKSFLGGDEEDVREIMKEEGGRKKNEKPKG